jgi:acyl carrier protein
MGLDSVELIIRIEEEFRLSIPREDAVLITTPRHLIDYLVTRPEVGEKWSRDALELPIWMILEDQLGIDRNVFHEDSRFVEDMGID